MKTQRDFEPRAKRVRYERKTGRVLVELTNGCSFAFPARRAQGLEDASDDELAGVSILDLGLGLHWEKLDVDLSVPGLLAGLFGTKAWMDSQLPIPPVGTEKRANSFRISAFDFTRIASECEHWIRALAKVRQYCF